MASRGARLGSVLVGPAAPYVVIVAAVVGANIVYLAGVTDPNPVNYHSQLASAFGPAYLPGVNYVDPNIGTTSQALGHLAASSWLHGHVPWWNYYEGLGTPLAGEMQSAAFFPPVLLEWFSTGQVWFRLVLEIGTAVATYLLLRRLVSSRWAAVAGAVAFGLNGTFAWMFHAPANPVMFAPVLILGLERARDPARRFGGVALVALAVALSIYAGSPEVAYIDGLLAALWFVLRASEKRRAELAVYAGRVAAGAVIGLLLAAPLLVAFLSYLAHGDAGGHQTGMFRHVHLDPALALPDLIMPYVFGPILGWERFHPGAPLSGFWAGVGGYLGVSVVLLALAGLVGRPHRRVRIGLGVWTVLALGRVVGVPLLGWLVNALPEVSRTAFFRYANPSVSLAVAVLAAFGIDDLARSRRWRTAVAAGLAAVAMAVVAARQVLQELDRVGAGPARHLWSGVSIAVGLGLLVVLTAAAALVRSSRGRAATLSGAVVMESIGLFMTPQFSVPVGATLDTGPVRFLQAHLGTGRFLTLGPISPDYGSYFQVASVDANDSTVPETFARFVDERLDPAANPLLFVRTRPAAFLSHIQGYRAAGVRYVVTVHDEPISPPAGLRLPVVYDDPHITIRELGGAAPLFSVAGGPCRVTASSLSHATVECLGPGSLVYREQYLPGWVADVGRTTVRPAPYQGVFQQVPLAPGHDEVRFHYSPPYIGWAQLAFLAGLVLLLGALTAGRLLRPIGEPHAE